MAERATVSELPRWRCQHCGWTWPQGSTGCRSCSQQFRRLASLVERHATRSGSQSGMAEQETGERATMDDVNRMRDIALKFFRGNDQANRAGYKEAGLLDELEALRDKLCRTLAAP